MTPLSSLEIERLRDRVAPRFRPLFDRVAPMHQEAVLRYFFRLTSRRPHLEPERPRVLSFYCPFAHQREFPSGVRYCINVYTGCSHLCTYCYVASYLPLQYGRPKAGFRAKLHKDLRDLTVIGSSVSVPPAPVHMSNSTDPYQPVELEVGDTAHTLGELLAHRRFFTTVVQLTKNPGQAAQEPYRSLLLALNDWPADHPRASHFVPRQAPGVIVEVSLAFARDEARAHYEPAAPSVQARMTGVRQLAEANVPLVLRLDPHFPRQGFEREPPQTLEDWDTLVRFAKEVGARHVVYSPVKLVTHRGGTPPAVASRLEEIRVAMNRSASSGRLDWHGRAHHLYPEDRARLIEPFLEVCARYGVVAKYCKQNLLETE